MALKNWPAVRLDPSDLQTRRHGDPGPVAGLAAGQAWAPEASVRPLHCPVFAQHASRGQLETQARIMGQGSALHASHFDPGSFRKGNAWRGRSGRRCDRDVPARGQVVHGECDTVDLRWTGFADDADAHDGTCAWAWLSFAASHYGRISMT